MYVDEGMSFRSGRWQCRKLSAEKQQSQTEGVLEWGFRFSNVRQVEGLLARWPEDRTV